MEETTETIEKEEPVEETVEKEEPKETVLTKEEIVKTYEEELNTIKFFTDQTRFNATMYQGMQLILQKLTAIEEQLNERKK